MKLIPSLPPVKIFLLALFPFLALPLHAQTEAVQASNQFAFDSLNLLLKEKGNVAFSPYSAWTALTMTSSGAAGTTLEEMGRTLHLPNPAQNAIHDQASLWSKELNALKGIQLKTANRLWADTLFIPEKNFKDLIQKDYEGGFASVNFAQNPEAARKQINAWVSRQTENRINHLLSPENVNRDTRLILTNAVYFNGTWKNAFDPQDTKPVPFTSADGTKDVKPMMCLTGSFPYSENGEYQAVRLDYTGNETSMIVVLPSKKNAPPLLNAKNFQALCLLLKRREVDLNLPRFTLEQQLGMIPLLQTLGMKTAFTGQADFSRMTQGSSFQIGAVVHRAFVKVGEKGTEAAAATAVAMTLGAMIPEKEPKIFRADHPFLFFIVHNPSGGILFAGRVDHP